ncbi:MAG: PAS domain S-box protein [Chloroflexi bacterium]|nr:PAS domain S-box protein [Chloroflexota bacterium]
MQPNSSPILLIFILAAVSSWSLVVHSENHLQIRGARSFLGVSLAQSVWTALYVLELISRTPSEKIVWDTLQWFPAILGALAMLDFAANLTGTCERITWKLTALPSIAFIVMIATEPLHGLLYSHATVITGAPFDQLFYPYRLVHWLMMGYTYFLLGFSIFLLARRLILASGTLRSQILWLILALSMMVGLNSLGALFDVRLFNQRDIAPLTFGVGNAIMGWGLFRYRLFDLAPRARRLAVERMEVGFIVTDIDLNVIDMNRSALDITTSECRNSDPTTLPSLLNCWSSQLDFAALASGSVQVVQRMHAGRMNIFELHMAPVRSDNDQADGYLVTLRDVTESGRLEESLRLSEARYRSIFDAMSDSILLYDADGRIIAANAASEQIFGIPTSQMLGKRFSPSQWQAINEDGAPLPPDDYPIVLALRDGIATHGVVMGLYTPDNRLIWLSINAEPLVPDASRPRGAIAAIRNITEYKGMQRQSMALRLERERSSLLANFIRNASHEFRTPLATINTSLYLLSRHTDETRRREHIAKAEREVDRLSHLVDVQTRLASLDSGLTLAFAETRVGTLMDSVKARFARPTEQATVISRWNTAEGLPMIRCNAEHLAVALQQIVDNALRHTLPGGTVEIDVRSEGADVLITISDTGNGIQPEDMSRIFERFWRQDDAHSTPGFGLGLPLAKVIVNRHGGTIDVTSVVGTGTRVEIRLPFAGPPETGGATDGDASSSEHRTSEVSALQ